MFELLEQVLPDFANFRATYIKDDDQYIIEPTEDESNDTFKRILDTDSGFRAIVLDEHGKLKLTYVQTYDSGSEFFPTTYEFAIYDKLANKTKMLECSQKDNPYYAIEDYKLKKIIDRLISTLKMYGAEPVKEERGSLNNNHLLWMLEEIYTQRKPLTKRYNWLGFVQCALVSKNIIDIKHERDIMYEIF